MHYSNSTLKNVALSMKSFFKWTETRFMDTQLTEEQKKRTYPELKPVIEFLNTTFRKYNQLSKYSPKQSLKERISIGKALTEEESSVAVVLLSRRIIKWLYWDSSVITNMTNRELVRIQGLVGCVLLWGSNGVRSQLTFKMETPGFKQDDETKSWMQQLSNEKVVRDASIFVNGMFPINQMASPFVVWFINHIRPYFKRSGEPIDSYVRALWLNSFGNAVTSKSWRNLIKKTMQEFVNPFLDITPLDWRRNVLTNCLNRENFMNMGELEWDSFCILCCKICNVSWDVANLYYNRSDRTPQVLNAQNKMNFAITPEVTEIVKKIQNDPLFSTEGHSQPIISYKKRPIRTWDLLEDDKWKAELQKWNGDTMLKSEDVLELESLESRKNILSATSIYLKNAWVSNEEETTRVVNRIIELKQKLGQEHLENGSKERECGISYQITDDERNGMECFEKEMQIKGKRKRLEATPSKKRSQRTKDPLEVQSKYGWVVMKGNESEEDQNFLVMTLKVKIRVTMMGTI